MSHYTAVITWERNGAMFTDNRYSRAHRWNFDGGIEDESHRDEASGVMAKNADGKLAMTQVTLRPRLMFAGEKRPSAAQHEAMHHEAHEQCFIASSVKTDVRCEAVTDRCVR